MSRIAKLKLEIKDYSTKDQAMNEFVGEVVSIDESLKTNLYRFFETDMGTILVSIDYHNEQVVIQENSETIRLIMVLKDSCFEKCVYHFDEKKTNKEFQDSESRPASQQRLFFFSKHFISYFGGQPTDRAVSFR